MKCEKCGGDSKRFYYVDAKRYCVACRPQDDRWALLHEVRLNKDGVRLTRCEAERINTNTKQPDGTYQPAKRFRSNDGWGG